MIKYIVLSLVFFSVLSELAAELGTVERPRVGLVLGGGGALGMSHIGVLRVLEEQRVPIDYIVGTSMGAIIAGLYSSGMSPDEIEAFLTGLNWNQVMSDDTPRRELYFRRKLEDQRYLVEMGIGLDGIKMGTGMAAGQKFNNLLQLQVQRSSMITDFDELSIPYRAVATDLQSGKAYVIDHGNLAQAMRASMAVPGAFTPIKIEGRLLVDGGLVNNLPVDVLKAMGLDVIIAVDVGAASDGADPEELKGIAGILSRTYAIMQRPEQVEQFKQADIGLQPELAEFSASQFYRVSELIPKGEEVARMKLTEFSKLSVNESTYAAYIAGHRRANPTNVRINAVKISGQNRVSEKAIRGRIQSESGDPFDQTTMQLDLMRIYGIGEFEQVLFSLDQKDGESGTLKYEVTEDPRGPNYLSVGLNLRSDFENDTDWNILINLTRRSIGRLGAEWRNEAIIGSTQGILSEFYQPLNHSGYFFVAPLIRYRSELKDLYVEKDHGAEYDEETSEAKFDFGIQVRRYAEFRIGPVVGKSKGELETGILFNDFNENYVGPQFSLIVDRKDRTYFPRKGYYFETLGIFPNDDWGGDVTFEKLSVDLDINNSINNHTMELRLRAGTDFGGGLPDYAKFSLGGQDNFSGLAKDQFRGSNMGVGSLGYRYRLKELPAQFGRGIYAITRFDMGNVWEGDMNSDIRYGGSLGVGIDLNIGPLELTYGAADGGYQIIYFSLGSDF